jgi:tetratricopeptide (TPR) repeat protein
VKIWKMLFGGGGAEKLEDKGDELRLDFEYREAAFKYQQALDALDPEDGEDAERLRRKLREVRRQAFEQLLDEAAELAQSDALELAHEKLEIAANFADEDSARAEVDRRLEALAELVPSPALAVEEDVPESVAGTEGDLFELAMAGFEPADRERAQALGDPFREAFEACQREDWAKGLELYRTILESHPDESLVLELAALAAENLDRDDEALDLYVRAREAGDVRPATVLGLASLYRKLGRTADAQNVLSEAAATRPVASDLPPAWVDIHQEHALALSDGGHQDEAASVLLSLLESGSGDRASILHNLGGVFEKADREEDARAALEGAMEAAPRHPLYRERFADFLTKRGEDLDRALRLLVEANSIETTAAAGMLGGSGGKVTISPNRPRYLYKIARIYFLKGEDLEAEKTITTALHISKDPGVTKALEELRRELKEVRQSN